MTPPGPCTILVFSSSAAFRALLPDRIKQGMLPSIISVPMDANAADVFARSQSGRPFELPMKMKWAHADCGRESLQVDRLVEVRLDELDCLPQLVGW